MADVEKAIEDIMEEVQKLANDPVKFSQEESMNIYEGLSSECENWASTLREEIEGNE